VPIHDFLRDAVVILTASLVVLLTCSRLRLPPMVGFLLTGVLIGPSGFALIGDRKQVELFAEIGVVLLLFWVGLELSLERLQQIRRFFLLGGSLQAALTTAGIIALALLAGHDMPRAVFGGFLVTLSSTAIVLRLYADRRELGAPQGRILVGILLFQDFLIVPMMVLIPILGGTVTTSLAAYAGRFALSLAALGLVFAAARLIMPRLLHLLVRTGAREGVVLGALLACLGMAWLTQSLQLSLALGAFIAGIILSESEYSHQVIADVTPLRDVFNSLFFVSIGMLLDASFALERAGAVATLAAAIVAVKLVVGAGAVALLGFPLRIALMVGMALAQVGEFSFVLLEAGRENGLVGGDLYQIFLAASILTMMATPALVAVAPRLTRGARRAAALAAPPDVGSREPNRPRGHVVVVGFGVNGRNLARVLRAAQIRYRVVEIDPQVVRTAKAAGEPVLFGDVTRREILEHAGVAAAAVIVFAISDREAVQRAIRLARDLNPGVHIVVRTRRVDEIETLELSGADEVIAEEFETSIEVFTRVLRHFRVPWNIIRAEARALRGAGYRLLRSALEEELPEELLEALAAGTTDVFRLETGSPAAGRTLRDLDLRRRSGATVAAVVRGEQSQANPSADLRLETGDDLVLVGSHSEIDKAFELLSGEPGPKEPKAKPTDA
jgi:CPA2 family monovalent cation:H+ antiporter-2